MMRIIAILLYLLSYSFAYGCTEISNVCVEGAEERIIGGKKVFRNCWKYESKYECFGDTYKDYCTGIAKTSGCEQIESKCTQEKDGKCIEFKQGYICGDLLSNHAQGVISLDSEHTIVKDELDNKQCLSHEANPNCFESENKCVEGAEERIIDGKKVFKDCWKYEKKYSCFTANRESSCAQYDRKCQLDSSECLNKDQNGNCMHTEKHYTCIRPNSNMPVNLDCKTTKYCIGDKCEESTYKGNKEMGRAISALSILSALKKNFSPDSCAQGAENCKVFKGEPKRCGMATVGFRNCCKDSGWGVDVNLAQCSPEAKMLATKKSAGLCHEVGSYCSNKKGIGKATICLETTRSYCCFNSKISRIVQEAGHGQLGKSWGKGKSPNCEPLTITELQQIDFSNIDFRELFGDISAQTNINQYKGMVSQTQTNVDQKIVDKLLEAERSGDEGESIGKQYTDEVARRVREYYDQ